MSKAIAIHSKPIFRNDINAQSTEVFKEVKALITGLLKQSTSINVGNRVCSLGPGDVRRLIAHMTPSDSIGLIYRNTILDACGHAEAYGSGGSLIALLAGIELCDAIMRGRVEKSHIFDLTCLAHTIRPDSRQCFNIIKSIIHDERSFLISREACALAGSVGSIKINRDSFKASSIELKNGYNFPISIVPEFCMMTRCEEWSAHDPTIILIDGIIESVGEINHLLEGFHRTGKQCLLIARGFYEEVIATLSTNFKRHTLNVVPAIAHGDLEGINILSDLAIACRMDVVSSLKGELISSIDPASLKTVEHVLINTKSLRITNASTIINVRHHIRQLQLRRNESIIEDKIELYNKRIMSLSANNIEINLGKDIGDEIGILQDRIDVCIRMFKDIANYGIIDLDELSNRTSDPVIRNVCKKLIRANIHHTGVRSLHAGLAAAPSIAAISQSQVFIVEDDGT